MYREGKPSNMNVSENGNIAQYALSFMHSLCIPPGKKWSGEPSRIFGTYSPKVVRTNEIARSVIITWDFPSVIHFSAT